MTIKVYYRDYLNHSFKEKYKFRLNCTIYVSFDALFDKLMIAWKKYKYKGYRTKDCPIHNRIFSDSIVGFTFSNSEVNILSNNITIKDLGY